MIKYLLLFIALMFIGCTVEIYDPVYCNEEVVTHYKNGIRITEIYNECTDTYDY